MTTAEPYAVDWQQRAACAGKDTNLWFSTNPTRAQEICGGCPVRPECLYDALRAEPSYARFGVRGGLTRTERRALPALPSAKADAIAMLRELLPPDGTAPDERTDQPMSATPPTDTAAAPAPDNELVTISKLLRWAEDHPALEVQEQGARAEAALAGLRQRYAADQELAAITTEAEQLEKRLTELRARKDELLPEKPKKRRSSPSYEAATVRAWARENNIPCPAMGRVPKAVVDAWRAAQDSKENNTDGR